MPGLLDQLQALTRVDQLRVYVKWQRGSEELKSKACRLQQVEQVGEGPPPSGQGSQAATAPSTPLTAADAAAQQQQQGQQGQREEEEQQRRQLGDGAAAGEPGCLAGQPPSAKRHLPARGAKGPSHPALAQHAAAGDEAARPKLLVPQQVEPEVGCVDREGEMGEEEEKDWDSEDEVIIVEDSPPWQRRGPAGQPVGVAAQLRGSRRSRSSRGQALGQSWPALRDLCCNGCSKSRATTRATAAAAALAEGSAPRGRWWLAHQNRACRTASCRGSGSS
jgi:hypothetical protein